jgi:hypothetical protein
MTKFYGTREQQIENLKAQGYQVRTFRTAKVVVAWMKKGPDFFSVKAWKGGGDKPAFFYRLNSYQALCAHVNHFVSEVAADEIRKAAKRAEDKAKRASLKAADFFTVGDVVYNSWGYEQTNIDWYEVTEVLAKSVRLRPIARNYRETQYLAGVSQPIRGDYTGPAFLKTVSKWGTLSFEHGAAAKWDGKAKSESHYA